MRVDKKSNSFITTSLCYHCGDPCKSGSVSFDDHDFCCDGCMTVYDLLKENNLCTYYNLNSNPGISQGSRSGSAYSGKFNYLDQDDVRKKLLRFDSTAQSHIVFYIPKIHCSSCIWLLENLYRLNEGVISATVNFLRKEATIVFDPSRTKLSEVVSLLARIGYEPLINLNDLERKGKRKPDTKRIIKIGIAGFCFGNIMMLSFPEYFSFGNFYDQAYLRNFFGYINFILALPVFFYSASEFFISAWKSIRHRYLNIDAPIALAVLVTFLRSVYEIFSHSGAGYMDSMCGIVFFMLLGRYFQNRTYETLSFERDYKSYFPVGVTVKKGAIEKSVPVTELHRGDCIVIRNQELVPADAILLSPQAYIDYSFITGESQPVKVFQGELLYAGGRQLDGAIELTVSNPTSQSYLTRLWNTGPKGRETRATPAYADTINKYFTLAVLVIAFVSSGYWLLNDAARALNAFTAVLIVACPCGLLLTTTFVRGNILRILGRNKFYLKNAGVIENLSSIDTILFDKTGTITHGSEVHFTGPALTGKELHLIASLTGQSSHPLSRKITKQFSGRNPLPVTGFEEIPGSGIKGMVDGKYLVMGSALFVTGINHVQADHSTSVYLSIDGEVIGLFSFNNIFRPRLNELLSRLSSRFALSMISGDNDADKPVLSMLFPARTKHFFHKKPDEKMDYVKSLRQAGKKVMMIGDGLNDAGALLCSDAGIAVSDDTNNFSPSCDAILDGSAFYKLPGFLKLCRAGRRVILGIFFFSLVYNLAGLSFAVQGTLSPLVAAVLMPISSISIVLLSVISTFLAARSAEL
jgi:Cu+-exporting ATPase